MKKQTKKTEKKWKFSRTFAATWYQVNYWVLCNQIFCGQRRVLDNTSYWNFKFLRLLPFREFWTIDIFSGSNEIYLFWLKVIVTTVKAVSEFGMVIDSLFCIRECNRCCLYWLKVMALLLKWEMYLELKKTSRNVGCEKLRIFSELYIGSRYRYNCLENCSTYRQRIYLIGLFRWSITRANDIRLRECKVETPMAGVQLDNVFRLKNDR